MQTRLAHSFRQPPDIAADLLADEGVHRRRREALELPELRHDARRSGDEAPRILLLDDRLGAVLVHGIEVGEEKADRDSLDAGRPELPGRLAHLVLVERLHHFAGRRGQPFGDHLAPAPRRERTVLPGDLLHDGVVHRPLVPSDVDDVAVAPRGHKPGRRPVVLEHRVRGDGRTVVDVVDGRRREALPLAEREDAFHHSARRVVRRGRHLVYMGLVAVRIGQHNVGERAADIDANQVHRTVSFCRSGLSALRPNGHRTSRPAVIPRGRWTRISSSKDARADLSKTRQGRYRGTGKFKPAFEAAQQLRQNRDYHHAGDRAGEGSRSRRRRASRG